MLPVTKEEKVLYGELIQGFDDEGGYQTRKVGNENLTYISGEQCVTRLNNTFGPLGWTFEIRERWYDEKADECCVLGRLTVFRKVSMIEQIDQPDAGSVYREVLQPIFHEQVGSQKHNRRRLTIITPQAYENLQSFPGQPPKQYLYTQLEDGNWRKNDSLEILDAGFDWKGAGTDALKKCASWFGIALELSRRGANRGRPTGAPQRPQNQPNRPERPNTPPRDNRPAEALRAAPQKALPAGFTPPFKSQKVDDPLACRADGCDVVMVKGETYETEVNGKTEAQKTEYIVKRAREEAGTVLCIEHVIRWIQAKRDQGIPLAS